MWRMMMEKMSTEGVMRRNLKVKLFGGGEVLGVYGNSPTVGALNIDTMLKLIIHDGIPLAGLDVGGTEGRNLYVVSDTAKSYLSKVKAMHAMGNK